MSVASRKTWQRGLQILFIFFVPLGLVSCVLEVHVAIIRIQMELIVVLRIAGTPKIPLTAEGVGRKWREDRHS